MHVHKQSFSSTCERCQTAADLALNSFDIKSINKFIKSIWELIISVSNATHEELSLGPAHYLSSVPNYFDIYF